MTKAKHVPKVYFHLPELAERWGLSMDELLSKALAGDLPVVIPHFGGVNPTLRPIMGRDPNQTPEMLHPSWAVSLGSGDLSRICHYGQADVQAVFRNVENGREILEYEPPRSITKNDLVISVENVLGVESDIETPFSESERETLLKIIAVSALAIAGNTAANYNGKSLNCSAIAKAIYVKLGVCPSELKDCLQLEGVSEQTIRKKISDGLKLLLK
jgi:hypothetical protein